LDELIGEKKLPKDEYFVLGDNRRISKDSRSFGTVQSKDILGKAQAVYYPLTHIKIIS
jgi:signal peptidase I